MTKISMTHFRWYGFGCLFALASLIVDSSKAADDFIIDGVPIAGDVSVATPENVTANSKWLGGFTGAWGGVLKHVLVVETISSDGTAKIIYANAGNSHGLKPQWKRYKGIVSDQTLTVEATGFQAHYKMQKDGFVTGFFMQGVFRGIASMAPTKLETMTSAGFVIPASTATFEFLHTNLEENGKSVKLETVIFKPRGQGPFPLAIINHGSTGLGRNGAEFTRTWYDYGLANYLNNRGYIVAFPQRRGRGKSDGLYDEGFYEDRSRGYTCDEQVTLSGAKRALGDLEQAVDQLKKRKDVKDDPILMGGISRGGILSMAYSGQHSDQVLGVINFVGGWLGEGCSTSVSVNQNLLKRGIEYKKPSLWLYGTADPYYSIEHTQANFDAFERAGGSGKFIALDVPRQFGHFVHVYFDQWMLPVNEYLDRIGG